MSVLLNLSARAGARYLQPRVGFWFSHSRLDACGPIADSALGDPSEQSLAVPGDTKSPRDPFSPQLHRVLEAQAAWVYAGIAGSWRHEQSDHGVGQQTDPHLFVVNLRRLPAQYVHARGRAMISLTQDATARSLLRGSSRR
jgi:hypothetical protein